MLGMVFLGTCGTGEDTDPRQDGAGRVAQREAVFNGAYENLDAAVIDRLLSDDFAMVYAGQAAPKDRQRFIDDLGQLRLVFPQLQISIDSSRVVAYQDQFIVQGIRTFRWRANGEPGTYRERFTNRWRRSGGEWVMTKAKIDPIR